MADANVLNEFSSWLGRISQTETPPSSVIAYNIGLVETNDGFSAYLIGADEFDPEDSDWACEESFTPEERYFPIPQGVSSNDWSEVHRQVADALRKFLSSANGKKSFLAKAKAVTVGFDDGELERII